MIEKLENLNFEKFDALRDIFLKPDFDAIKITELNFSKQNIVNLPPGQPLAILTHLKILILSHNNISKFTSQNLTKYTPQLETLDLSSNKINILDDIIALGSLSNLKNLNIKDNPICDTMLRIKLIEHLLFPEKYKPYDPVKVLTATYSHVSLRPDHGERELNEKNKFIRLLERNNFELEKHDIVQSRVSKYDHKNTMIKLSMVPCPIPRKTRYCMLTILNDQIISKQDMISILMKTDISEIIYNAATEPPPVLDKFHRDNQELHVKYIERFKKRVFKNKQIASMGKSKNTLDNVNKNDEDAEMKVLSNADRENFFKTSLKQDADQALWEKPADLAYKNYASVTSMKEYKKILKDHDELKAQQKEEKKKRIRLQKERRRLKKKLAYDDTKKLQKLKDVNDGIFSTQKTQKLTTQNNRTSEIPKIQNQAYKEDSANYKKYLKKLKKEKEASEKKNLFKINNDKSLSSGTEHDIDSDPEIIKLFNIKKKRKPKMNLDQAKQDSFFNSSESYLTEKEENKINSSESSFNRSSLQNFSSVDEMRASCTESDFPDPTTPRSRIRFGKGTERDNDKSAAKSSIQKHEIIVSKSLKPEVTEFLIPDELPKWTNSSQKYSPTLTKLGKESTSIEPRIFCKKEIDRPNIALPRFNNKIEPKLDKTSKSDEKIGKKNISGSFNPKSGVQDSIVKIQQEKDLQRKNTSKELDGDNQNDEGFNFIRPSDKNMIKTEVAAIIKNEVSKNPKIPSLKVDLLNSNPAQKNLYELDTSPLKPESYGEKIDKIANPNNLNKKFTVNSEVFSLETAGNDQSMDTGRYNMSKRERNLRVKVIKQRELDKNAFKITNKLFFNKERLQTAKILESQKNNPKRPTTATIIAGKSNFSSTGNLRGNVYTAEQNNLKNTHRPITGTISGAISNKKLFEKEQIKNYLIEIPKLIINEDIDLTVPKQPPINVEELIPSIKQGVNEQLKSMIVNEHGHKYDKLVELTKMLEGSRDTLCKNNLIDQKINITTLKATPQNPKKILDYNLMTDFLLQYSNKDKLTFDDIMDAKEILYQINDYDRNDEPKITLKSLENKLKKIRDKTNFSGKGDGDNEIKKIQYDLQKIFEYMDIVDAIKSRTNDAKTENLLRRVEKKEIERAENNAILAAYVLRIKKYYSDDYIKKHFKDQLGMNFFDQGNGGDLFKKEKDDEIYPDDNQNKKVSKDFASHIQKLHEYKKEAPFALYHEPRPDLDMPRLKKIDIYSLPTFEEMTETYVRKINEQFNKNGQTVLSAEEKMIKYAHEFSDNAKKSQLLKQKIDKHISEMRKNIDDFCKTQIVENDIRHDKQACFKRFVKLMRENKL